METTIFDVILDKFGECSNLSTHVLFCKYAKYATTRHKALKVLYLIVKVGKVPRKEYYDDIDKLIDTAIKLERHYSDIEKLKDMCVAKAKLTLNSDNWNESTPFNDVILYIDSFL